MCVWQALPLFKLVKLREQRYHGSSFSTLNLASLMLWCRFCYHDRYETLRFLVIRTNALHEGLPSPGIVGEQTLGANTVPESNGKHSMCLVEVERSPKPVASWCVFFHYQLPVTHIHASAMPAMPGSKVFTNTPLVHEARYVTVSTSPCVVLTLSTAKA